MSNMSSQKKHLFLKMGQSTAFLSAIAVSAVPSSEVQQLGFLALATVGLVCWAQASALHKEIHTQLGPKTADDKHNALREYVIWGHTAVATSAASALSGVGGLTLGVLAVCSAALIANAVDNYQLLKGRKTLSDSLEVRRTLATPLSISNHSEPKI